MNKYFLSLLSLLFICNILSCVSLEEKKAKKFFEEEISDNETFRIFISKDIYAVKQIKNEDKIKRIPDKNGDLEKKVFFSKEHNKINFKNIELKGVVRIELNSSGEPVNIGYANSKMPRTWQASKHFVQDIARFRFTFPTKGKAIYQFNVSYFWSVTAPFSISDSARKKRAIQYLRSQKKQ